MDLRNPDDADMYRAEQELEGFLRELKHMWPGLATSTRRMAQTRHVAFDLGVQEEIARAAQDLHLNHESILSGAGHDAQELAAICPTAMVFVPGEYDGISHNPREWSTPDACTNGVNVLATVVRSLAG